MGLGMDEHYESGHRWTDKANRAMKQGSDEAMDDGVMGRLGIGQHSKDSLPPLVNMKMQMQTQNCR